MTPDELEALADRVEAGTEDKTLLEALVYVHRRGWEPEWRARHSIPTDPPALVANGQLIIFWDRRGGKSQYLSGIEFPRFLSSLDAAAQVMPEGWRVVTIYETAFGKISASHAHREHGWGASGTATTECAARVAAGLRARAHEARKAGAK